MPYAPGIQDRRGEYILAGMQSLGQSIQGFGSEIGDTIRKEKEKREKEEKELAINDQIIQHGISKGYISQEDVHDYKTADRKKKGTIAMGVVHNMAEDWQRQMETQQQQHAKAQTTLAQLHAKIAEQNAARTGQPAYQQPISPTQSPAPWNKQIGVWTGEGAIHPLPGQQPAQQPAREIVPDPTDQTAMGERGPKGGMQLYPKEVRQALKEKQKSVKDNILLRKGDKSLYPKRGDTQMIAVWKNGVKGYVPESQIDDAIAEGYQ
jgi:hypothetical protein